MQTAKILKRLRHWARSFEGKSSIIGSPNKCHRRSYLTMDCIQGVHQFPVDSPQIANFAFHPRMGVNERLNKIRDKLRIEVAGILKTPSISHGRASESVRTKE